MPLKNRLQDLTSVIRKYRVRFGILVALVCFYFAHPTPASFLIGIPVIILGQLIRAWASGHILKSSTLTVSGPYSYFRHPLYIGSLLVGIGFTIISLSIAMLVCLLIYFGVFYPITIIKEETHLNEKFQQAFQTYKASVPVFSTAKSKWYIPGKYSSFKSSLFIFNREYRLIIVIIVVLVVLYIKMKYFIG